MTDNATWFRGGYKQALLDVAEKLNNADINGYTQHEYSELMDMMSELGDGIVEHDELLKAGR